MKKALYFILVVFMAFGMVAAVFAGGQKESADAGTDEDSGYYFGFAVPTTQGGFMAALTGGVADRFKAEGHRIEVADAEVSPAKQIEQIENFITLGVDEIIVMGVDPSGLTDVLKRAMDKDIKVFAFTQKTEVYDKYAGSNNYATGERIAEMAANWIEKNYPDAAPGSIDIAIFENRNLPDMAARADGMHSITDKTDKVNLVEVVGVDGTPTDAQKKAENLFLTNPDIKVVLSYNTDTGSGVNAYVTALNSQVKDKAGFATFACDFSDLAVQLIGESKTNDSVFRGVVRMGSTFQAMIDDVYTFAMEPLTMDDYEKDSYAELYMITADNMAEMLQ